MSPRSPAAKARRRAKRAREWLVRRIALTMLRNQGYACANCLHFAKMPGERGPRKICDLRSDYHGYTLTTADDLCLQWERRCPTAPPP